MRNTTVFQLILVILLALSSLTIYLLIDQRANIYQKLTSQQETIDKQASDNEQMALTILLLVDEVQLRQDITSVIVDASRAYSIDPMLLTQLIKSESNFRPNIKHAIPTVECMSGINTKQHPKTLHNPTSVVGCVYASAEILAGYIETSDSLTLALTRYKGLSPQGFSQAKKIVKEYNKQ